MIMILKYLIKIKNKQILTFLKLEKWFFFINIILFLKTIEINFYT